MELSKPEADSIAEGIARVEKYYPAVSAVISGRIADHVALIAAVGSVYGPRMLAIKMRVAKQKAENVNGDGGVIDMTAQFRNRQQQTPAAE